MRRKLVRTAIWAIGNIRPPLDRDTPRTILSARSEERRWTERTVCWALGRPRASDYASEIASLARIRASDEEVRRTACWSLGHLGSVEGIPILAERLGDTNKMVRWSACIALSRIGTPAVPTLANLLNSENFEQRWLAAEALRRIGVLALPSLVNALDSRDNLIKVG